MIQEIPLFYVEMTDVEMAERRESGEADIQRIIKQYSDSGVPIPVIVGVGHMKYTDSINNFPPNLQGIAELFFETFLIPVPTIPTPKQKGTFGEWIKQFEHLNTLGGGDSLEAMPIAFEKWKELKFVVARPSAINKVFSTAISEIAIQKREKDATAQARSKRTGKTLSTKSDAKKIKDIFK